MGYAGPASVGRDGIVRVRAGCSGKGVVRCGDAADAVVREHAAFCGLSALMTTTVGAMEETIDLLRREAPWCKVMVGGAVMTPEYAEMIGADHYSKDAMGSVHYAQEVL